MTVLSRSRAQSVVRDGDQVIVTLTDGRTVDGSHCLLAVGSVPNTAGLGLEEAGVEARPQRASSKSIACHGPRPEACMRRATAPAYSCWPRWPRCRAGSPCGTRWVTPCLRSTSRPFRQRVHLARDRHRRRVSQAQVDSGEVPARVVTLPLRGNAAGQDAGQPRRVRQAVLPQR